MLLQSASAHKRRSKMIVSAKHCRNFISRTLAAFSAAASVSAALEGRRHPHDKDLRALGINPADFGQIK